MMGSKAALLWISTCLFSLAVNAQVRYDLFEVKGDELTWQNVYKYPGKPDSLRPHIVKLLKSKFFTFNVIRNETGYNGEIKHYNVNAKQYGRTYLNTPRMYWDGEWSGKFIVDVYEGSYRVTVYALYFDTVEKSTGYYRTEKPLHGRLIDVVTSSNRQKFRKSELSNLTLLSVSLKEQFDIVNPVHIED